MAATLIAPPTTTERDGDDAPAAPRAAETVWPVEVAEAVAVAVPEHTDDSAPERDYARKVAAAWLLGIVAWTAIVTGIVLLAGGGDDIGVGGAVVVGLCSGFWLAPLAGVIGVGRWASRWQH
jgi:hypothetical protein